MSECNPCNTPMEVKVKLHEVKATSKTEEIRNKPIRELVGCLSYVMLNTRPDLSISVNYCSRFQDKPSMELWKCLKRILRYIKGTVNYELFYAKDNKIKLVGYADSDLGNGEIDDRIYLQGLRMHSLLEYCLLKKQESVAVSTTETEYIALSKTA